MKPVFRNIKGKRYFMYALQDGEDAEAIAKTVADAVRRNGGKARVIKRTGKYAVFVNADFITRSEGE